MNAEKAKTPVTPEKAILLDKILRIFGYSLALSAVGAWLGQFIPKSLFIPLFILELIVLIALALSEKKERGYPLLILFTLLSGMTLYPLFAVYLNVLGKEVLVGALVVTAIIFFVLGTIGYRLNKDLSGWGMGLFVALLIFLGISIIVVFLPYNSLLEIFVASAGIILFSMYTVYDFNQIKQRTFTEDEVPSIVVSLYLDFLNLFLDVIRMLAALVSD